MLIAAAPWNEKIIRYVIENFSRPFDMVLDGADSSGIVRQIGDEMLRNVESCAADDRLLEYICSLPDNHFDLICLNADRLMGMTAPDLRQLLGETLRVLVPGGHCAFLIADDVRSGKIVPKGFQLVHRFLASGFNVASIMNGQASEGLPFRLAPHQYLAVFRKPESAKKLFRRQIPAPGRKSLF